MGGNNFDEWYDLIPRLGVLMTRGSLWRKEHWLLPDRLEASVFAGTVYSTSPKVLDR